MVVLLALGAVFVLMGLAFAWYGLRPLAVLPRLLRAPVLDPGEVGADDGFVVCRATAAADGETVAAPFTGRDCLGVDYEVTERHLVPNWLPVVWHHADDGVASRAFSLSGTAGTVRVVPDARRYALDVDADVVRVGAREAPPERVRRFVAARDELSPASHPAAVLGFGARRYAERRVDSGETYLVAGEAGGPPSAPELAGDLVVSDRGPRGTALRRLRRAAVPLFLAAVFLAVGGGLLVLAT